MRVRRKLGIIEAGTVCAGLALLAPASAWSAAFALQEQSASRLGTAFAGAASAADDLSTMYYNVAGLAYLERPEVMVVVSAIDLNTKFKNDSSTPALTQALGVEGGDAGAIAAVPSAYAAMPLREGLAIGLAINVPFGLVTDWDDDWMGRFQARLSKIETINVAPSIAWRPIPQWSIGAGINYQRFDAILTNSVSYSGAIARDVAERTGDQAAGLAALLANPGLEGRTRLKGDDETWGFNVGMMFEPVEGTRFGLSYRSKYNYKVKGTVSFGETPVAPTAEGQEILARLTSPGNALSRQPANVRITLPELATASVTHRVGSSFRIMADVSWQRWSQVQELRVKNSAGETISLTPEEWEDSWRFNVGGEWQFSPTWKFRTGIAFDQTPVPASTRTPRLPDSDRYWIAFGAQWKPNDALTVDAGYAHLFADKEGSEQTVRTVEELVSAGALIGDYNAHVNIVAVQLAYRF